MIRYFLPAICILLFSTNVISQNEGSKKEMRGTWMATVINLDWPTSQNHPVITQKNDLRNKIQDLHDLGINMVYFQIRTEADALYDSPYEPWSKYLTGEEGVAPDPYWDPLEFAIEEAHKRGMELHAWLNPYRAMRSIPSDFTQKEIGSDNIINDDARESLTPFLNKEYDANHRMKSVGTTARDSMHVSNKHPEWLLVMNNKIAIMNPGLPEVIDYNLDVVMDVVNRYDVDGIHFDDYFYPYPPNHMGSSSANNALDDSTFIKYPRGFTNKAAWRRNNVDIFVAALYDSIQVVKPWVKFGISPFGIWKNGTPSGIVGLDAYSQIYGDGVAWLEEQTVDYLVPQLYWAFGGGQDFGKLAPWWSDKADENDRHLYTGHGLYRSDINTYPGPSFSANEIPSQVRFNRQNDKIKGSVFFRSNNLTRYTSKGFADSLKNNLYKYAALPPTMHWKDTTKPETPTNLIVIRDVEKEYQFKLSWEKPSVDVLAKRSQTGHVDSLIKYAVYRVDSGTAPNELAEMEHAYNLIEVTGDTTYTDIVPPSENGYWYFVTAVSRNNVESNPTPAEEGGVVVSNDEEPTQITGYTLSQNYPNPFNPSTEIQFRIAESGFTTLKVYDMLGREVSTLINDNLTSGSHTVRFDASNLASGIYIYRLVSKNASLTRKMSLIK